MACLPKRYTIAILSYFGFMLITILQLNFDFAFFRILKEDDSYENIMIQRYASIAHGVGLVFSFIGGIIAHRYGGATVVGTGAALSAFINFMTPFIIDLPLKTIILIKFTDGLSQAFAYTGMVDIWARWYPAEERSKIVAFVLAGSYSGFLYQEHISELIVQQWGWSTTFSICGTAAVIWSIMWFLIVRSDPAKDETLSGDEKEILAQRLKYLDTNRSTTTASEWKKILLSVPVLTLCFASFVHNTGEILPPLFAYENIMSHGKLSKMLSTGISIFVIMYLLVAGYLADYGRKTKFTPTKIHKIFICAAFSTEALVLIAYTIIPESFNIVTYYGIYYLVRSFGETALCVNTVDLSPKYASFIGGFQLSFMTLCGLFSRLFVYFDVYFDIIYSEKKNFVFASISILYLFGAILYYYGGSGELQSWNIKPVEEHELKRSKNDQTV